jgi:hypothetical protein
LHDALLGRLTAIALESEASLERDAVHTVRLAQPPPENFTAAPIV